MKKLFLFAAAAVMLASCGGNARNSNAAADGASAAELAAAGTVYTIDDLMPVAGELVGQDVTVRGYVTHTCKHSGKRCFIVGEDQNLSFRVEAKGNIGGFNRELVGSELAITGKLHERRLSEEYLDQLEKDLSEKALAEDGSAETCEAEIANIEGMKQWMQENGKDYYAIYYMDGEDYEILGE
ncbi:MAG: hypothetical protein LIO85_09765 [Rikenellaceae bacterium]|nr:hypothetical protein [Rikenellaceae bacterium]